MQLEFDKPKQQITIKDEVATHSWLVIILIFVNILNMGVQLFSLSYHKNEILFIFMLLLALASIFTVFFYLLKKSWKNRYKLSEIEGIEIKSSFGRERLFLKLYNRKKRSFSSLKNEEELKKLKQTLTSIGIKLI